MREDHIWNQYVGFDFFPPLSLCLSLPLLPSFPLPISLPKRNTVEPWSTGSSGIGFLAEAERNHRRGHRQRGENRDDV